MRHQVNLVNEDPHVFGIRQNVMNLENVGMRKLLQRMAGKEHM
jgi:hypothetical protein